MLSVVTCGDGANTNARWFARGVWFRSSHRVTGRPPPRNDRSRLLSAPQLTSASATEHARGLTRLRLCPEEWKCLGRWPQGVSVSVAPLIRVIHRTQLGKSRATYVRVRGRRVSRVDGLDSPPGASCLGGRPIARVPVRTGLTTRA